MQVYHGLEELREPLKGSVLSIGNFDGVHRGHQQLLAQSALFAANTGGPVVVLTFEPHPLSIVAPDKTPPRLSPLPERLRLLAAAGAEITVVARSDPGLLALEAEAFVHQVLVERFHPTHIVEGPSFRFGRGRRGTPELLRELAAGHGFEVHILDAVHLQITEGETLMVSSSLVRQLLLEGRVHRAAMCLGRPYAIVGAVSRGHGRGRDLGIPTANLEGVQQLVPGDGVYAARALVGDQVFLTAVSVGSTPTFKENRRQIEAHLLDFDGDLYGQPVRLEFHRWIRGQVRFPSVEALLEQMQQDIAGVRAAARQRRTESDSWTDPHLQA